MFGNIGYSKKTVTVLVTHKDVLVVKSILKYFKSKYKNFDVSKYRTGNIGENILLSFKVDNEFYSKVLEKFAYNDLQVILNSKEDADLIDSKKEEKIKKLRSQGWSDISSSQKIISFEELQKLSENGKIKEVVKESRGGAGTKIEIVTKARDLLGPTVLNAIKILEEKVTKSESKREEVVKELISISKDKDLKTFQKNKEQIIAGEKAIALILEKTKLFDYLIKIANDSKISNMVNLKAAIAIAGIILSVEENEELDLPDVSRSLNTRWLSIAYETVQNKLSNEEQKSYNDLLNYIEEKKTAA